MSTLVPSVLMLWVLLLGTEQTGEDALPKRAPLDGIRAEDIQRHVDYLASDALEGRFYKGKGGRLAARYIADRLEASGLEPFGDEKGFFQGVGIPEASPNVVAIRRGTGRGSVLVTAHYDHLQPRKAGKDRIYNGADDNASGVAAILEVAQALGEGKDSLSRSIVIVAFTGEEAGFVGSRYFVRHPPMPLHAIRGVLNLDMVSRGRENLLFVEGGPRAPELLVAVKRANEKVRLDLRFDEHPDWLPQSDQLPFLRKGVPALYFGVEDHEDYHKVSDHADKILSVLAARAARLAYLAAKDLAR